MKKIFSLIFSLFLAVTMIFNQSHVAKAANYHPGGFSSAKGIQVVCIQGSASLTTATKNVWGSVSPNVTLTGTSSSTRETLI